MSGFKLKIISFKETKIINSPRQLLYNVILLSLDNLSLQSIKKIKFNFFIMICVIGLIKFVDILPPKTLSNISIYTKKAILHLQNVSIKYLLQTLHDDCLLNDKQIFFTKLLLKR